MTDDRILFKQQIKSACEAIIRERIENSKKAMSDAQASANNEEKSSAGDKYETLRAMGHLDKDMHARQMNAHLRELSSLMEINVNAILNVAGPGAFIRTGVTSYFLAAGLGKQRVVDKEIICLSVNAPLGQLLNGKVTGETIQIGKKDVSILEIF
ncbi:MAG: hypothetical protein H7Y27_01690 [Gemmatimonadaceae bacterium]|nr:hypothetical protein [Chitinophagaceae bacterium]